MIIKQEGSVHAIGRLTRDPEQKPSSTGKTPPVKAAIAVGEKENVQFLNIIAWYGRGAMLLTAHKGDLIEIGGMEKKSSYTSNRTGEEVEKTEIDCELVRVLERKGAGASSRSPQPPPPGDMEETDEDMPF